MKLSEYLNTFEITVFEFAKNVGVSCQTVYRWLDKTRNPTRHYQKITEVTKGNVTPNDWILTDNINISQHFIYTHKKDGK